MVRLGHGLAELCVLALLSAVVALVGTGVTARPRSSPVSISIVDDAAVELTFA